MIREVTIATAVGVSLAWATWASADTIFNNGGLNPTTTSKSGVPAPEGLRWSEVQNPEGNTAEVNTNAGFGLVGALRLADDFAVPIGEKWKIDGIEIFAYQTGAPFGVSPFSAASLRIWRGQPGLPESTIVFGDTTTNRLVQAEETNLLRIFNSVAPPPGIAPTSTRRIWRLQLAVSPRLTLTAGAYWVDWAATATNGSTAFAPSRTVEGTRGLPGWNGRQLSSGGVWEAAIDIGSPIAAADFPQDFPFQLIGPDISAPETTIVKGPKNQTRSRKARFEFASNEPDSTFRCALNDGDYEGCASPLRVKVPFGPNTFRVRARDDVGNRDKTPAIHNWTVNED